MELCVEKRSELVLGLLSSEIRLFRRESEFSYFRVFFYLVCFCCGLLRSSEDLVVGEARVFTIVKFSLESVSDERSVVRSLEMASSEVTMKQSCLNHNDGGGNATGEGQNAHSPPSTAKGR